MITPVVRRISEYLVKPRGLTQVSNQTCNLTSWDIAMLSMHYIQKGLLFKKPATLLDEHAFIQNLLENLKHSLSLTLFHFYPLSGRLVTHKTQNPPTYTVSVDCSNNSDGARFIYATLDMTIADILSPIDVPHIVQSLFDHHKAVNHDGHSMPLLSIQVTELVDGVFVGCSMNHAVCDGTSYWNFINTWSQIFQAQPQADEYDVPILHQPIHNRWFPSDCTPPINLPFKHHNEFISRANSESNDSNTCKISSFQSLSALVWRSITRACSLPYEQKTRCRLAANNRSRMEPPLPHEYFGNSIHKVSAETRVGELLENDLGWAALKLHSAVARHNDREVLQSVQEWLQSPVIYQLGQPMEAFVVMISSSPRFDMYGNEFGMEKAVAVRSGYANKFHGKVISYPGREGGGSIDLELCLLPHAMCSLESDEEFMNSVSISTTLY
ncbi:shikimate O-hydroxycinnamoyltransferase [Vigna unguiculata]|uniref:Shikimate O-hydroxycinnamoyltransferase n=1 Tax=Vigna unguiculata TaxID=3917 RepID=A0A4D6NW09_VIGUN|nr:shikimate O-hydroxycinnamoyltransferase [Vigna unguiculata]